jgi:hypothetical protein
MAKNRKSKSKGFSKGGYKKRKNKPEGRSRTGLPKLYPPGHDVTLRAVNLT